MEKVGVIGAGAMGSGIAQVASSHGHEVLIYDANLKALDTARSGHRKIMDRLVEKGKIDQAGAERIIKNIHYRETLHDFHQCDLVIEAVVENLQIKKEIFTKLENIVGSNTILASNTSSLSITSIASSCDHPENVVGIHFFNPAPLMPLVEIIPALQTGPETVEKSRTMVNGWGKVTVLAKDTPGFIVNRVARPFYGEALRILDEGIADSPTIDWAMTHIGGFRMGPFTLMDLIGNDVNYAVTESVYQAFYFDPRYKPSFTQKRMAEAGYLGRKTGRGYFDYSDEAENSQPIEDEAKGKRVFQRILVMLINEAADALFWNIASRDDIDLAMTKGVNYPKGLLRWADEIGISKCVEELDALYAHYKEDRYRCSPLLRTMSEGDQKFYP